MKSKWKPGGRAKTLSTWEGEIQIWGLRNMSSINWLNPVKFAKFMIAEAEVAYHRVWVSENTVMNMFVPP
jgi:hypothetical protein